MSIIARGRSAIEHHFGLILMTALVSGLFVPGLDQIPKAIIPHFMAVIIFFAASKVSPDDMKSLHLSDIAGLYIVRFVALPLVLFMLAAWFLPTYKFAILMLMLLPTGATLPAVTAILGGNPMVALGLLSLTSFLCPFIVPAAYGALSGAEIVVDGWGMFKTLAYIIFLPSVLYALTLKFMPAIVPAVRRNSSCASIILIAIVATTIVASQRDVFFADKALMLEAFLIGFSIYMALYLVGWVCFFYKPMRERISYTLACGNNNIVVGISLAFLYLPEHETAIIVTWELAWLSGLSLAQYALSKAKGR